MAVTRQVSAIRAGCIGSTTLTLLRMVPSEMVSLPRALHPTARRLADQPVLSSHDGMTSRLSLRMVVNAELAGLDDGAVVEPVPSSEARTRTEDDERASTVA